MGTSPEMERVKLKQQMNKLGKLQSLNDYITGFEKDRTRDRSHRILFTEESYKLIREAMEEYIKATFLDIQRRESTLEAETIRKKSLDTAQDN